jgi:hypothetical protein
VLRLGGEQADEFDDIADVERAETPGVVAGGLGERLVAGGEECFPRQIAQLSVPEDDCPG